MDVQSAPGSFEEDAPRHLFFGCEDRRLGGRAGLDEKHLTIERSRRLQLASHVENSANQLLHAVRSLRAFDRTGDALNALPHLEHTFEDLQKYTTNLVTEVNKSMDRYGDGIDLLALRDAALAADALHQASHAPQTPAAAVEPSPQQAPAAAGPQLTAVHNHGPEDGPGLACAERQTQTGLRGACQDGKPKVTPLTLVQNTAFSLISAGLDEAQAKRAHLR